MVPEAPMQKTDVGAAPAGPGWFTVNVRDAAWLTNEYFGSGCVFEGEQARFDQIGYELAVLQPGRANGLYHLEPNQEDFLVLSGECLLLIEGEERPLKAWDFVHCPPDTEHVFVGAGDGPCVLFMIGARSGGHSKAAYPRSELALRHGAGVETATPESKQAYAPFPRWHPAAPPNGPWNES